MIQKGKSFLKAVSANLSQVCYRFFNFPKQNAAYLSLPKKYP